MSESNELDFEVIALPAVELPIEVRAYDAVEPWRMIGILGNARDIQFSDPFCETGAGSLTLPADDPHASLPDLSIIGFWIDNDEIYSIRLENRVTEAGDGAARRVKLSGRGAHALPLETALLRQQADNPTDDRVYIGKSKGYVLNELLTTAAAGGNLGPFTWDFTGTHDSNGDPWIDASDQTYRVGSSILSVLEAMTADGLEWRTQARPIVLHAYREAGTHTDVVLQQGEDIRNTLSHESKPGNIRDRIFIRDADGGYTTILPTVADPNAPFVRDAFISWSGSSTAGDLTRVARTDMSERLRNSVALTLDVMRHRYRPWSEYQTGDWLRVNTTDISPADEWRVRGINVNAGTGGGYEVAIDLNSRKLEASVKLARAIKALAEADVMGGGISAATGGSAPAGTGTHAHTIPSVSGLSEVLENKADDPHGHIQLDITGLADTLALKADADDLADATDDIDALEIALTDATDDIADHETRIDTLEAAPGGGTTRRHPTLLNLVGGPTAYDDHFDGEAGSSGPTLDAKWTQIATVASRVVPDIDSLVPASLVATRNPAGLDTTAEVVWAALQAAPAGDWEIATFAEIMTLRHGFNVDVGLIIIEAAGASPTTTDPATAYMLRATSATSVSLTIKDYASGLAGAETSFRSDSLGGGLIAGNLKITNKSGSLQFLYAPSGGSDWSKSSHNAKTLPAGTVWFGLYARINSSIATPLRANFRDFWAATGAAALRPGE